MIAGLPLQETVAHTSVGCSFCHGEKGEHAAMNIQRFSDVVWNKTNLTARSGEFLNLHHLAVERIETPLANTESRYRIKHAMSDETLFIVIVTDRERDDFKAFLNAIVMSKLNHKKHN